MFTAVAYIIYPLCKPNHSYVTSASGRTTCPVLLSSFCNLLNAQNPTRCFHFDPYPLSEASKADSLLHQICTSHCS